MEGPRIVEDDVHHMISDHISDEHRLEISRLIPIPDVLLVPCRDAAPGSDFLAVLSTDEIQRASFPRLKMGC